MPLAAINAYLERLPARRAELQMTLADVVALPHMREAGRRRVLDTWRRAVRQAPRPLSKGVTLPGIAIIPVPTGKET